MSENKNEIRKKVTSILSSDLSIPKKTLEIVNLTMKLSPQVGIEFLSIYSEMFNESKIERMSSSEISRILDASIPNNVTNFLKFFSHDIERLQDFTNAVKKFIASFPYTHMEVLKSYQVAALTSSYFFADNSTVDVYKNLAGSINSQNYGLILSSAILAERNDVVLNIIDDIPASFLSKDLIFEMVEAKNYNWKVISKIAKKINLDYNEPVEYSGDVTTNMSFSVFVAYSYVLNADSNLLDLFRNIQEDFTIKYHQNCSFENGPKDIGDNFLDILMFFNKLKSKSDYNYSAEIKNIINVLLDKKDIDMEMYLGILNLSFDKKTKKNLEFSTIKKTFDHPAFDNDFISKKNIISKLIIFLAAHEGQKNIIDIEQQILGQLSKKYPKDIEELKLFGLWRSNNSMSLPNNSELLSNLIKKDLVDNIDYYSDSMKIENIYGYTEKFLINQGFLIEKITEKKEGNFFNKKTVYEKTLEWDAKAIKERTKYGENKQIKEKYSFLTSDSGEEMKINLIKTLPNKHLMSLSENLVMIAYQFSNFSNDPLVKVTEESHFLKNNLPKMFNKIIEHYHEFKIFDETAAVESLTSQLIMLQKKTSQCMNVIIKDVHYDLTNEVKINEAVLKTSLTAKP